MKTNYLLFIALSCCPFFSKAQTLTDSLKAHYLFDGNLLDSSPNGEDIRIPSSTSYQLISASDSAYDFDGATQLQTDASFDNSSYKETTLSLWVNTSSSNYQNIVVGAYIGFAAGLDANGKAFFSFDGVTSGSIKSSDSLNDGKWHHLLGQNDGTTTSLYIDGVYSSSLTESLHNGTGGSNNIIYFGGPRTGINKYDGLLDDVRIYNRTLSQCEISELSRKVPLDPSLKAFFKFDGDVLDETYNNEDLKSPSKPSFRSVNGADSAYYFDGSTRLESKASFDNSDIDSLAVSFWFNSINDTVSNLPNMVNGGFLGFGIHLNPAGNVNAFFDGSSANSIKSTSKGLYDGKWHHVVAQNNGDSTYIYVDGKFETSGLDKLYSQSSTANVIVYLGMNRLMYGNYTGLLNDIRIYNEILSDCEIDSLFTQEKPRIQDTVCLADLAKKDTTSLKAFYKFNGNLLDETFNNEDILAPSNQTFELINGSDSAYSFDGNTRLETKSSFDNSTYKETALSLWINTSSPNYQNIVVGANIGFGAGLDANGKAFFSFDGITSGSIKSNDTLNDGKWHHLFGQNDGITTDLYIDGIFDTSITESLYNGTGGSNNIIYFGAPKTGINKYDGLLNNVRIYDQVLSACEIDSLFHLENPTTPVVTSIDKIKSEEPQTIQYYPNPTNGNLTIQLNEVHLGSALIIRNSLGQAIYSNTVTQEGNIELDIEGTSGLYFLELVSLNSERSVSKIIKK